MAQTNQPAIPQQGDRVEIRVARHPAYHQQGDLVEVWHVDDSKKTVLCPDASGGALTYQWSDIQVVEPSQAASSPRSQLAAVVVNDRGEILPYTVQSTREQCAEAAEAFWGTEVWNRLQTLGSRVVSCEIVLHN